MSKFKREERYIVIKIKDLNPTTRLGVRNFLKDNKIKTTECVVVESKDRELYEKTWNEIEGRYNG